jgi:hypothetical protein
MIFKLFLLKNSVKKLAFLTQNKGKLCEVLIISLVFEKNAIFFSENWRKSQKIVIITSTLGSLKRVFSLSAGAVVSRGSDEEINEHLVIVGSHPDPIKLNEHSDKKLVVR